MSLKLWDFEFIKNCDLYYFNGPTNTEIQSVIKKLESRDVNCIPVNYEALIFIEDISDPYKRFKRHDLFGVGVDNIYFPKSRKNELKTLGL